MRPNHPSTCRAAARGLRAALLGCILAWVSGARPALAQSGAEEGAVREMLRRAQLAARDGDHARALDIATQALAIRPSPSVRLVLAQQYAELGELMPALENADRCLADLAAGTPPGPVENVLESCRSVAARLNARVGRVLLRLPDPRPEGLEISVAGRSVRPEQFAEPRLVLPGRIFVEATAPGFTSFHGEVDVEAGTQAIVAVQLEVFRPTAVRATGLYTARAVEQTPANGAASEVSPALNESLRRPIEVAPDTRRAEGPGAGPWVFVTLGLLGLASVPVFYVMHTNAFTERDAMCSQLGCQPGAVEANNRGRMWAYAFYGALGGGGGVMLIGFIWYGAARARMQPELGSARVDFHVTPLAGGAAGDLTVRF